MHLFWLLTSTTYGTWLPGDPRGFVGRVWDARPEDETTEVLRVSHNQPATPYDADLPGLQRASQGRMKGSPVYLSQDQAEIVLAQFQETAAFRGWQLNAGAVMANHFHLVVSVSGEVSTDDLLRDFKSYASRALNKKWEKPQGGTWWTASSSRRRLPDEYARDCAIRYVLNQHRVLAQWRNPIHTPPSDDPRAAGVNPPC